MRYHGARATGSQPGAWLGPHVGWLHGEEVLSSSHGSPPWCVPQKGFSLIPRLCPAPSSSHTRAHSLGWGANPVCPKALPCSRDCGVPPRGVAGSVPSLLLTPWPPTDEMCGRVLPCTHLGVQQRVWVAGCASALHVCWEPA